MHSYAAPGSYVVTYKATTQSGPTWTSATITVS